MPTPSSITSGTLASILRERALRSPDALAFRYLVDGEEEAAALTYAELDLRARSIAARLAELGAAGERALLLHPPGLDFVAALFGCAYAGVVAVPAYPPRFNKPMLRLRTLVADARARFALTTGAVLKRIERQLPSEPELARLVWITPERAAAAAAPVAPPAGSDADALALLQYTSGSTSAPKGVMLTHAHLLGNAALLLERLAVTSADRTVSWLPPYHDMGLLGGVIGPVLAGIEATLLPPGAFLQRPARWLRALSRYRGTITGGPDFAWDQCVRRVSDADLATLDLSPLRVAFSGAERVRPRTLRRFAERFAPAGFRAEVFSPCYGLAEATLAVALTPFAEAPRHDAVDAQALAEGRVTPAAAGTAVELAACGTPLPGFEVLAVDPELRTPRPPGEVGELWIRGPTVAAGYWRKPEATARTFGATLAGEDGVPWLRTGDLGYLREGRVYVSGRQKDLVVLAGRNHHPEDLELTASDAHPGLRPGGAIAFSTEGDGEERLVLALEVEHPRDLPAGEIVRAVRGAVGDAHELAVHEVVLVPPGGLPRTSSGKVQRGRCRELWAAGALPSLEAKAGPAEAAPPPAPGPLVEAVQAAAAEVLGVARVEPDDDFFQLGGHSLLATQLVSRLAEAHGVDLEVRAVFEAPTPRALAARLAAAPPAARPPPPARLDRAGPLPLTHSQERMWFLHALDPAGSAYNVGGAVEIAGPLDPALLDRALAHVVREHEVLRTTYPAVDGVPSARIAPPEAGVVAPLALTELSGQADPQGEALRGAEELAAAPFDLARGPLLRARLFRTGPERHVLAVSLAHVVADGWALGLLLSRWLEAYQALRDGRAPPSDPGALQFVDFAAWHRARLDEATVRRDVDYWRAALAGAPLFELPLDRPRPSRPSGAGGLEAIRLDGELVEGLRGLARDQGTTPFMVMLAAFQVLLHRVTGQTDLVLGIPVAQRNTLASEQLIGSLVNTLPVRGRVDPDATFAEHLRAVREASLDAYAHQDLPFERLVAELEVERRAGRSPLFPVLFDYQNSPMSARAARGLSLRPLAYSRRASQFDLSLMVVDTELGHLAGLEYASDVLEAATARRLGEAFATLLAGAVADPGTKVSRLPLLSPAARRAAVAASEPWCQGEPPAVRVVERFAARAAAAPERTAVVDGRGAMTYGELDRASNRVAAQLAAAGVAPGQRVAVFLERTRALPAALLGVLKAGAAYVPLDPRYPADRIAWVLEDARPAALVTDPGLGLRLATPAGLPRVLLDPEALARPGPAPVPARPPGPAGADEVAYVIYTSGSTGRPKGVEVTHRGLSNFLASMAREPGIRPEDRILAVTTVSFDIAGLELFLPLVEGASLHLVPSDVAADPALLARALEESAANLMQATPSTWRMLLEHGWRGDPRLTILCGGEALPRELADALLPRCAALWNMYGPTETTIWSTLHRVGAGVGAVPIGHPVAHNRLYLLDRHGEPVPQGVAGELHIGGAGVAKGYLGRPELTAERFPLDPFAGGGARMYRTGDLCRRRADGELEYLGRLDQQVKIRGHRIEPGEIEAVLARHPGVRQAAVVARPGPAGDARLVAYVVAGEGPPPERSALRDLCRRVLPEYMVPAHFVALDALPLTPNGKLDRAALPAPEETAREAAAAPVAPRDPVEVELARIWSEVLGTPVTGVTDDFFDVGGHSLLAARVFARIEQRLGVALPVATLLEAPTIEQLAGRVRAGEAAPKPAGPRHAHLLAIRRGGGLTPLYCVHGAGGHVLNLYEVGRKLAADRPFYGLQARGVDGVSRPFGSIAAMADTYLAEVRSVQPHGPYHLSGYCGGALVAYEMAQRLRAAGEEVATLALIDVARPGERTGAGKLELWTRRLAEEGYLALGRLAARKLRKDLARFSLAARLAWHSARGSMPHELRDAWLTRAFLRMVARYRPAPYPGPLVVLRARDRDPSEAGAPADLGWGAVARGGVTVHEVPGDHHSLAQEPNVRDLAELLEGCVRSADAAGPSRTAQRATASAAR